MVCFPFHSATALSHTQGHWETPGIFGAKTLRSPNQPPFHLLLISRVILIFQTGLPGPC